jgi:alkaline phosphatase D
MIRTDVARRRFVRALAVGSALAGSGVWLASCGHNDATPAPELTFTHGVASGDPGADRVVLWTRAMPPAGTDASTTFSLDWKIATDKEFTRGLQRGTAGTSAARDYTVKADVTGLAPATVYFYRFLAGGQRTAIGRTKTLPLGPVDRIRLVVFTGCDYGEGYFHVYAEAVKLGDGDAAVHLGAYIHAAGYPFAMSAELGRLVVPADEAVTLDQLRLRYAQYRTNPDLQALHPAMPMIAVWNDQEFADPLWAPAGGAWDPSALAAHEVRRAAAMRAYEEWMPIRLPDPTRPDRIYRSFEFGNLASLHMLDTRHAGRDQPLGGYLSLSPVTRTTLVNGAWEQDAGAPARQMLGEEQASWLDARMTQSAATWQLLGQQVLMVTMRLPAPVLSGELSVSAYQAVLDRPDSNDINDIRIRSYPSIPYSFVNWDGYAAARDRVFATALSRDKSLVSLAGGTNCAWASDLRDAAGRAVGVEFAAPAVSSTQTDSSLVHGQRSEALNQALPELIGPLLEYAETTLRGMMLITATATELRADWLYVDTVTSKTFSASLGRSLKVLPDAGQRRIVEV